MPYTNRPPTFLLESIVNNFFLLDLVDRVFKRIQKHMSKYMKFL